MQIAVNAMLLRAAAPDLALIPGRSLMASVIERGPQNVGIINLAGAILTAELPEDVRPGDRLRLVVRESTNERLLMQIAPPREAQHAAATLQPPAPAEVNLPGGRAIALVERRTGRGGGAAGGEEEAVALRLRLPALGEVELHVSQDAAATRVRVLLAPEAVALGAQRSQQLRAALEARIGRPADVAVAPRRQPLDVYA
ncbi:hypothetical protein Q5424_03270 [Conexibacter sp. JD483]|uniref:hypothetical protein n=1 Tax=unclassified Conexibacter TaxID=2627773 RepID=UPI00271B7C1C|nr:MULTISPECIES: hypothetical protein [unclassified Conexibacter]MDO8184473.1 hypothetical protein [Conexibacter sp. CPCC 205706]MDO8197779.1 hypothetical protein [Conexibacter sp. CPCC 205762]MDR9368085.1 hypothetical protein [Conexibacter sp. JD483]